MKFKFFRHLALVTKHRHQVFKNCVRCGLFWRGLVHDLSKFSPAEFFESVKYFNGKASPLSGARIAKGYTTAWLHHKGRNKHHTEYWYDPECKVLPIMPYKYAVECVCDKIAATKCYKKKDYKPEDVLNHWKNVGSLFPVNEKINKFLTTVFTDLVNCGEKHILNKKYMKKTYKEIVEQ